MSSDEHRGGELGPAAVLQRVIDAYNAGDFDLGMSYIAADAVNHGPPPTADLAGWLQSWITVRAAFPDIQARIEQTVEQGDTVCHRYTMSGTNTGGDAPSGRRFEILGIDMVRVRDGKIVEHWALADAAGIAAQLGHESSVVSRES